jgi:NADPH2:quinone reductase
MKAAYFDYQGTARDVLNVGTLTDPEPSTGQVRVKIYSSSVNPTDIKTRTGFNGVPMPFQRVIPHQDGAGVIDKVGAGVSASRIGERVWIYEAQAKSPYGTAAEYTVINSEQAIHLPDHISYDIGSCLGIPAITAYRCLFSDIDIKGKNVLIHGGSGAVGTAAILLAKQAGAWISTTISDDSQIETMKSLGADLVINRHKMDFSEEINRLHGNNKIDIIVDVNLSENIEKNINCLANNGIVSAYATENPDEFLKIPFLKVMLRAYVFRFVFVYKIPVHEKKQAIQYISKCLDENSYHPVIAKTFLLDQIVLAHETQEKGKNNGKIIIHIDK